MIALRDMLGGTDGWGRPLGRKVYDLLRRRVDEDPTRTVFGVSLKGIEHLDLSFASESIVEIARRYRGEKGFYLTDLTDDVGDNIDGAATRKEQPLIVWSGRSYVLLGALPNPGTREAFAFAMGRPSTRASEFAEAKQGMSIANSSTKFKQLWTQGFLMREGGSADTGGTEFVYRRICDMVLDAGSDPSLTSPRLEGALAMGSGAFGTQVGPG